MFVTTHALTGGLLASKVPNPLFSYPLILISHFLMDRLPHWDFGTASKRSQKILIAIFGFIDLTIALILSWLIFQKETPFLPIVWGGVILSFLPDLIELPALLFEFRPFPLNKFEQFHSRYFHRKNKFLPGLIPQIIILALVLLFR